MKTVFAWKCCASPSEAIVWHSAFGITLLFIFSMATQMPQTPAVSGDVVTCMHMHACVRACERTLASWWTLSYLLISSPVCPHASEFHHYLTAANKQFAALDGGNALHPDERLSNPPWVSSSYGEGSAWHLSTDKSEANYLLPALRGSTETGKVMPWPDSLAK